MHFRLNVCFFSLSEQESKAALIKYHQMKDLCLHHLHTVQSSETALHAGGQEVKTPHLISFTCILWWKVLFHFGYSSKTEQLSGSVGWFRHQTGWVCLFWGFLCHQVSVVQYRKLVIYNKTLYISFILGNMMHKLFPIKLVFLCYIFHNLLDARHVSQQWTSHK